MYSAEQITMACERCGYPPTYAIEIISTLKTRFVSKPIEERIITECEGYFGVTLAEIFSLPKIRGKRERRGQRVTEYVKLKRAISYFYKKYTPYSLAKIGDKLEIDHATVLHNIKRIEEGYMGGRESRIPSEWKTHIPILTKRIQGTFQKEFHVVRDRTIKSAWNLLSEVEINEESFTEIANDMIKNIIEYKT